MDSIDPAFCCEEIYHVDEVAARLLEPRCEPSHVFHLAKEAFDDIAHGVEIGVVRGGISRIRLGGDDRQRAFIGDILSDLRAAVSFVQNHLQGRLLPVKKRIHHLAVVNMTAGDFDAQWLAVLVYGHVNFACATAS